MGAGRRVFSPGEVLTASNTMNYLMDQSVMNFAGTAARGSAIGTATQEGMVSYLQDTNFLQVRDDNAWHSIAGVQAVANATVRDSVIPSPNQGDAVFRVDRGWVETYYGLYNASTNPGGVSVAGWYPTAGNMPQAKLVKNSTSYTFSANSWNAITNLTYWDTEIAGSGGVTIETNGTLKTTLPGIYEVSAGIMSNGIPFTILTVKKNSVAADGTGQVAGSVGYGQAGWNMTNAKTNLKLAANDYVFWAYYSTTGGSSNLWSNGIEKNGSFFTLRYLSPPWGA